MSSAGTVCRSSSDSHALEAAALQRGNRLRGLFLILLALSLLGYVWLWQRETPVQGLGAASLVPAFSVQRLDGGAVSSAEFLGRGPLALSFFSPDCRYCQEEIVTLVAWQREHPEVGLALITDYPDSTAVETYLAAAGASFPAYLDPEGQVFDTFGVIGTPTTFFIDADARVRSVQIGGPMTETQLLVHQEQLLATVTVEVRP